MSLNITIHSVLSPVEHVTWNSIDDEAILLDLRSGFYYTLNEVGCDAWQLMDTKRTLQEIAGELCAAYDASQQQIESDLIELAKELEREQLATIG